METEHSSIFEQFKKHLTEDVGVFFGSIVSYAVVASDTFSDTLKSLDRNVLVVETESAGVFEIAKHFYIPVITVRGVSDFADNKKTQFEVQSKNVVRSIAAMNAAYYIYYQLCSSTVVGFLNDRRNSLINAQTGELFTKPELDPLDALLRQVEEDIDLELKEKCPAYRHKPRRSFLPSPRVLRVEGPSGPDKSRDWDAPIEIADIVEQCERLMISLEPTYPDRALPWVIADIILRTNGSRIYVPIVVDGEQISPKRFNIKKLLHDSQILEAHNACAKPVLIIDDPNLQSSTRVRALIDEANENLDVRFVVLAKKYNAPVLSLNFAESFNCERFAVANFSLGALSDFVSTNFGYDLSQSAVLATKLNDTFEQFNMHAHPSYFAGISPESLAALMAANRRGELIHLAVDAALMIMVAEDKADIQVSKRWRREFLKDIAVLQFVRGERVDEERAIKIAKNMAEARDIDIKALEFVHSFVRAGVFDFRGGEVDFILVYVRDYLVAEYLYQNPRAAVSYFGFDEIDEDYNVLDMYSELGPSDVVIDTVSRLIEDDAAHLDKELPETINNIISNKIQLSKANSFGKYSARKQSLLDAIEYVGENPTDLQRKQYLVDLRRSVSQKARQSGEEDASEGDERQQSGERIPERDAQVGLGERETDGGLDTRVTKSTIAAHWSAGCVILGAGAEQMEAQPKRRLARGLISLGCRIAEHGTAEAAAVDYDDLKDQILSDPNFKKRRDQMSEAESSELMKDFEHLLHFLEFTFVTSPYRIVLAALCGQATGNVLRKSVKETKLEREFQKLTQAVWACDLDAGNAAEIFKNSLGQIGKSTMLRFVLTEHFISRVYWAKWRAKDRKAFLEVATKLLDDLDSQIDKGKMGRMIDRTSSGS